MANHASAKKAIRQTQTKTAINRSRISRIRTFIKKFENSVKSGDKDVAQKAFVVAQSEIMRGVSKKIIKKNSASRKISRLAVRLKALSN